MRGNNAEAAAAAGSTAVGVLSVSSMNAALAKHFAPHKIETGQMFAGSSFVAHVRRRPVREDGAVMHPEAARRIALSDRLKQLVCAAFANIKPPCTEPVGDAALAEIVAAVHAQLSSVHAHATGAAVNRHAQPMTHRPSAPADDSSPADAAHPVDDSSARDGAPLGARRDAPPVDNSSRPDAARKVSLLGVAPRDATPLRGARESCSVGVAARPLNG